jgi:hypothetical protein
MTSRVRAESVHAGMKVGARASPTGDIWWCVGCGGLFADDEATMPLAIPTSAHELLHWREGHDRSPACPPCPGCGETPDRYAPIELVELKDTIIERVIGEKSALETDNKRLRDDLAAERTAHTATRSSLHDAMDNPIFED